MVGAHAVEVLDVQGPLDLAPLAALGAGSLQRAGIAGGGVSPVDHDAFGVLGCPSPEHLAFGAAVLVALGIVGEARGAIERRPLVEVRQRDVGADLLILDVDDVLDGPVGRVAGHLVGSDLPAEADPPEHVQERQVLHHVGRGHQDLEDDAGLPAIHGVVVVIPKVEPALLERHQGGVGVGGAGLEVGAAPIAVSDDGPIRSTVAGQPVVALLVGVGELLALGLGDRDGQLDRLALAFHGSRPRRQPHR